MHPVGLKQPDDELKAKPSGSRPLFREPSSIKRRHSLESATSQKRTVSHEGEGEFTVEDISNQDTGYDGDVEVVWPYQYEDMEEDATATAEKQVLLETRRPSLKCLEHDDVSHSGLIDWMGSLRCNSDREAHRLKRGRKRKHRPSLDSIYRKPSLRLETGGRGRPGFTTKRLRRETSKSLRQGSALYDPGRTDNSLEDAFVSGSPGNTTTEVQGPHITTNDSMDLD